MSPGTIGTHINKRRLRHRSRAMSQTGTLQTTQSNLPQLLAIAASTGGLAVARSTGRPTGIQTILVGLGADFRLPTLVAQHIARGFVEGMVAWLNRTTPLTVRIAQPEEPLLPGHIYLAPDQQHLLVG